MRRYLWIAALALGGCVSSSVSKMDDYVPLKPRTPKPVEARKKIAVVEFVDRTQYGKGQLGTAAADVLSQYLMDSGQFRMFERIDLAKVMDEQKLGGTGLVDPATAAQVGKLNGVEYVAVGVVTNFGFTQRGTDALFFQSKTQVAESEVTVKVIDVNTSEIIFQKQGRGGADTGTSGVLGAGGRMSFDQRLAGRSLKAAISTMVDNLIDAIP